ncbi:MAG: hypothetical protein ACRD5E_14485 [Nitrososphaeraceae archaeon]
MKSPYLNNLPVNHSRIFSSCTLTGFSLLLLLLFISLPSSINAVVDIDTSGDGSAAAYDGEEGIATDGDSFCSVTNDIAGGKFSSLFEGIVGGCDDNSEVPNQFLVEYSFTKNPVEIGEKSYLTVTVKDKNSGNPISNAFVTLDIKPPSLTSFETSSAGAAVAAAGISSNQEILQEKTAQAMNTDHNGSAIFTVQVGPKSDLGTYDTELEVTKDRYQSSFEQINFQVISQPEKVNTVLRSNNEDVTGGDGGAGGASNPSCGFGCTGDGGDGGAGGDAAGGNALGGDGGAGGDAAAICDGTAIGGAGGYGGDATNGIQGMDGENGSDEMAEC